MTFDQAICVAVQAQQMKHLRVLAIGHFVPVDELRVDTPWAISVLAKDFSRPTMIRVPSDLDQFKPIQNKLVATPSRLAHAAATPMLFD